MAQTYIPILGADGNTYFFAITPVIVNGITQYYQAGLTTDPLTGLAASVTAAGTSGVSALSIQGVTNGTPIPTVNTGIPGAEMANLSPVLVQTTSTTLISAVNTSRVGFVIYNEGPSTVYVTYGPTTIVTPSGGGTYSTQLGVGDRPYIDTIPYYGIVSAIVATGNSPSWVLVTELV